MHTRTFAEEEHEFYVADGRGLRGTEVCSGDKFAVDLESSGERTRECKWTLEKYIKLSRMKYEERKRFVHISNIAISFLLHFIEPPSPGKEDGKRESAFLNMYFSCTCFHRWLSICISIDVFLEMRF